MIHFKNPTDKSGEESKPFVYKTINKKVTNAQGTSEREPLVGESWIDFWLIKRNIRANKLNCASCGKEIYVDVFESKKLIQELSKRLSEEIKLGKVDDNKTIEVYKAEGCHVKFDDSKLEERFKSTSGLYIVPLCCECNGKKGKEIVIKAGSVFVPENGCKNINK